MGVKIQYKECLLQKVLGQVSINQAGFLLVGETEALGK